MALEDVYDTASLLMVAGLADSAGRVVSSFVYDNPLTVFYSSLAFTVAFGLSVLPLQDLSEGFKELREKYDGYPPMGIF